MLARVSNTIPTITTNQYIRTAPVIIWVLEMFACTGFMQHIQVSEKTVKREREKERDQILLTYGDYSLHGKRELIS